MASLRKVLNRPRKSTLIHDLNYGSKGFVPFRDSMRPTFIKAFETKSRYDIALHYFYVETTSQIQAKTTITNPAIQPGCCNLNPAAWAKVDIGGGGSVDAGGAAGGLSGGGGGTSGGGG